ncbi:DUF2268 domain-containing putative Zn-dependent protease [Ochrobactrum sp. AN78]|uniref:DUF2268 domain-containing putative Zn-dependent protease n=1 Tax=Ochrobactrum sp. AN78 TaxID=3039853 RepID=UPI002989BC80|nr:DUF2268 domain-containing putative Zn-dependent protease [Ochrobactrum sp. AN78]MDH7792660.1 hypothetical protein [Ochrobactrum sp. AN78]
MTTAFKDVWFLHWLTASGGLEEFQQRISIEIDQAFQTLKTFTPPPQFDILLGRSAYTIPEIGILGRAYNSTLLSLNFDPDNTNLRPTLTDGTVQRQLLHEVHHCLRMAGPGYGWTLGEALISEGLAGHFVNNLMKTPPEPWECAIAPEVLRIDSPTAAALQSADYDHASWFFGSGQLPRWLGYSLGFELVRIWRETTQPQTFAQWINTPATEILAFGEKAGLFQA